MIPQHLRKPIVRDPAAKMMDMVHSDIGAEPAQDARQVIMRAAVQPGVVTIPTLVTSPKGVLELMLDIEQPDANRSGKKRDRQLHQQEWTGTEQPDHAR